MPWTTIILPWEFGIPFFLMPIPIYFLSLVVTSHSPPFVLFPLA